MKSQYLTFESAISAAHDFFNKGEYSQAIQYFEYSNRIKPSEQASIGIILINLIFNNDLQNAMQKVSMLQYSEETLFKAYRAVIAQYYYKSNLLYDENIVFKTNKTRVYIEKYLTNNFNYLHIKIGKENANTIKIMLLKLLLQCYNSILFGESCIGSTNLPDTYTINTEGNTINYGYYSKTKLNTTLETQKNYRSDYARNIDLIGESMNELNFQLRCNQLIDEIHMTDPKYDVNAKYSISNLNYLMGGYLKYLTYKKFNKAGKRNTAASIWFFMSLSTGLIQVLLRNVGKMSQGTSNFQKYFIIVCFICAVISLVALINASISKFKWKNGEYVVEDMNTKKHRPHSDL